MAKNKQPLLLQCNQPMPISNRQLFLQHVAQTSPAPMGLEIAKASGCSMWDKDGKEYIDGISGFCVANIGHGHPAVIEAITRQANDYMHLMVYGEMIEAPQVAYANLLIEHLPPTLDCVYFTNSGTEATEGAMKLAKRYTGRTDIVAFKNAYHGSTQGALSLMGDEYWRNAYRPLLPGVFHADYNEWDSLDAITSKTACVVAEVVQAEAGVKAADKDWLQALRLQCTRTGTLLVLDEIQTGFGRTGTLWAFEQYGIVPDILLLGKALGGGMPLGAFIANKNIMQTLTDNPVLGHISTFAGHPVCCAAGMAAFHVLLQEKVLAGVFQKEALFHSLLHHPAIQKINSKGLLMALKFESAVVAQKIVHQCIVNGFITDWFLFGSEYMRVAPPLVMSNEMIEQVCKLILKSINEVC